MHRPPRRLMSSVDRKNFVVRPLMNAKVFADCIATRLYVILCRFCDHKSHWGDISIYHGMFTVWILSGIVDGWQ